MRLSITGEYPHDWDEIARRVCDEAQWRCVRCRHPFNPAANVRPQWCDDLCDLSRGPHIKKSVVIKTANKQWSEAVLTPAICSYRDPRMPGLNFGVHHLDGDKSNCRWWNLLALCNSCHLTIQSRVIPERAWLFEHSEWFKPYVAGFYAFWFANAETVRAGVEADIDYFLALGQPWLYAEKRA